MPDSPKRLIEVAFPLKQTSLDSVHEKNVRHGHISTLHIWPARRPLAACRAALITTLLPDPGDPPKRKEILDRLAGKVVQKVKRKKVDGGWVDEIREETEGGILHWGRESGPDLDWFRQKIREAYGGRAPKVLDPFAGGGAIPLEAMRLGCETTAVDINPVAWFILKCTLEYPQKLAGQTRPLPDFAVQDAEFMREYFKAQGFTGVALEAQLQNLGLVSTPQQHELPGLDRLANSQQLTANSFSADLAWHVRAWGSWVLKRARKELAPYYPTYADFEPLVEVTGKVERRPMTLVPLKDDGTLDIDALNAEFTHEYLADRRNPRWVAKPTVAYLWARTVTCKNCRAIVPLLKTRWLCKKENKRVVLTMQPNAEKNGVIFGVETDIPVAGKTAAERRAHDQQVGGGTMSRSGVSCPCCETIMTLDDIKLEGLANHLKALLTTVVTEDRKGKRYRLPTSYEIDIALNEKDLEQIFSEIPLDLPTEAITEDAKRNTWCVRYGVNQFQKLFTPRQLLSTGTFIKITRQSANHLKSLGYVDIWKESIYAFLAITIDKVIDYNSMICTWHKSRELIGHTFVRYVLPMVWDFAELPEINDVGSAYSSQLDWITRYIDHGISATRHSPHPLVQNYSSTQGFNNQLDAIITDPPYYDAIGYSILMDFFYVWLKRTLSGLSTEIDNSFKTQLAPKWDKDKNDGELIDDSSRFGGNKEKSKKAYEDGMFQVFEACFSSLNPDGRLVIVFANKQPDAWETLVSAVIRAGFVVTGSWPIQTEMVNRTRALSGAALSSSVWLICKKRPSLSRPGWDNKVLEEMYQKITARLRDFWDAGIRGPDFVWAATGPALEAYSQYPVVKKANQPGEVMTVFEFLAQVRRMVVDFVVGRVLSETGGGEEVTGLDNVTTYYLLHRHDFGMNDAPAGPCILYAVSCGLSDKDLADRYDILARRGGKELTTEDTESAEEENGEEGEEGSGSEFRLKAWNQRKHPNLGYEPGEEHHIEKLPLFPDLAPIPGEEGGVRVHEIPLIDQVHRLMHLWKSGDVSKVNEYLDLRGLRRNPLFHHLLQALIELAPPGSEERALMESISNHVGGRVNGAENRLF